MKKIITLFLALVLLNTFLSFAQEEGNSILYLTNGYSVVGTIVEQTDDMVKIKTIDGRVLEYPAEQVERIGKAEQEADNPLGNLGLSENTVFTRGTKVIHAGFGFSSQLNVSGAGGVQIPPLLFAYEQGIKDELFDNNSSLGIGAILGFSTAGESNYRRTYMFAGLRGAVHYQFVENLDTYAGLMIGGDYNSGYWGSTSSLLQVSAYLGSRYYFTEKFGAFLEFGLGMISYGSIGVSMRF